MEAELTSVEATTATGKFPGESSGPALLLTVTVQNRSKADVDLDNATINLFDSSGAPCNQIISADQVGLKGSLAPGAKSSGQYLFTIGKAKRNPITVQVIYSGGTPVGVFKGSAS